jgi:hypothetical protein
MKFQPLTDWVESGRSPWTLNTARIYAQKALKRTPGFTHLPFVQFRKRGRIFVDLVKATKISVR